MFGQIGGQCAIGAPSSPNQIGGESFIRHVGNDKLILDFHEGSGTVVYDKSHCGNNGTLADKDAGTDYPTWLRNELSFDGVNNYININYDASLICSDLISMETVFKTDNVATEQIFISRYPRWNFQLYQSKPLIQITTLYKQFSTMLSNQKYHLIITYDEVNTMAYSDGSFDKEEDFTVDINPGTEDVQIGKLVGYVSTFFDGIISLVRLYNKKLSGIEAQQIYLSNRFRGNN